MTEVNRFEAHAYQQGYRNFTRYADGLWAGEYIDPTLRMMWRTWCAALPAARETARALMARPRGADMRSLTCECGRPSVYESGECAECGGNSS